MSCRICSGKFQFKEKLGRCKRCMIQLACLSLLGWGTWITFFYHTPFTVEAITAFSASAIFSALLALHLVIALYLWSKKNSR
ncbi:DUF3624 domain-containing protein [Aliivibrio kagoshimensis]|uniref:DUF3624 domain-containing protein n=1 Tax=Aliivibrio kagoshimensis TaxID=2910230 RepID=UPI003D144D92